MLNVFTVLSTKNRSIDKAVSIQTVKHHSGVFIGKLKTTGVYRHADWVFHPLWASVLFNSVTP